MRRPQSDPTHTHAPVCPCLRAHYAREYHAANEPTAGRVIGYHALSGLSRAGKARVWRGYNKRFNGPTAGFWGWPIRWPRRGVLRALAGLKRALLGLCVWLAMLGKLGAGLRCLFSLCKTTVLGVHTVGHGLWPSVCLSVWHSPGMASPWRMA